jgi:DNA-binding GntR family transcriptional regulator
VTEQIGPSYQRVASDIRARIISGEYEVGAMIPSTPKLASQHKVSTTVVRHAVEQLRAGGILVGHPGKGVYVKARPDAAAAGQRDLNALSETVSRLEDNLMELYGKLGYDYPRDETGESKRQRRERTVRHG